MKKPAALAEMIARKAFNAPQFQQSWQAHMQVFEPILSPAYADCYTAKVHLTNILNKISRRDIDGAQSVMETLVRSCGCDTPEEKALLCFLKGLCCEVSGNMMAMFSQYTQAGDYGHSFYLPHLKSARFAHDSGQLDVALTEYCKALPLIRKMPESPMRTKLLGSTLTNTASCLTYMHLYEDAAALLDEARTMDVARIEAVEAVLLAAIGQRAETEARLAALVDDPEYEHICTHVRSILDKHDPHFHAQPMNEEAITAFWKWFSDNEQQMLALYNQRDEQLPEEFVQLLDAHLAPCFPFEHPPMEYGTSEDEGPAEIFFFTGSFHRSLNAGCMTVIEACPADIASRWVFTAER